MSEAMQPVERIVSVATEAIRLLVSRPEELRVEVLPKGDGTLTLRVEPAHSDVGKVIGQAGRTARSLRILLLAMSAEHGWRISLDIVTGPAGE